MYAANFEEPRRKRRRFFVGMEYGNRIVRPTQLCCVPAAIKSGDCGEHPFKEKGLNDEYSKSMLALLYKSDIFLYHYYLGRIE